MSSHSHAIPVGEPDAVFEQYQDIHQQNETYIVGMWSFLVTEVMFFGALFLMYTLYRWQYQPEFYAIHKQLHIAMGATNTVILLLSSFSMAMAVRFAQLHQKANQLRALGFTVLCACGFLVIKFFEYREKIQHHLLPGPNFQWHEEGASPERAQLFFSLYFAMTGLHGVHVLVGILIISFLMRLIQKDNILVKGDYIPTELIGLYWHFVDLVWIFLFPLFYLMPR